MFFYLADFYIGCSASSKYNNDWNGTLKGSDLPEGAYYYILTYSSNEVHTGGLAIIR